MILLLAQRAVEDSPRWTRAVGIIPPTPFSVSRCLSNPGHLRPLNLTLDTTVWGDYLRGTRTPYTNWLDAQLPRERLGLPDLILCEAFRGSSGAGEVGGCWDRDGWNCGRSEI